MVDQTLWLPQVLIAAGLIARIATSNLRSATSNQTVQHVKDDRLQLEPQRLHRIIDIPVRVTTQCASCSNLLCPVPLYYGTTQTDKENPKVSHRLCPILCLSCTIVLRDKMAYWPGDSQCVYRWFKPHPISVVHTMILAVRIRCA